MNAVTMGGLGGDPDLSSSDEGKYQSVHVCAKGIL